MRQAPRDFAQAQAVIRQQQAAIDQLKQQVDRLTHERDAATEALKEERVQHAITRRRLAELHEAVEALSEQHKTLLRRAYGASSERLFGNQELLKACLEELDPDTASAVEAVLTGPLAATEHVDEPHDVPIAPPPSGPDTPSGGESRKGHTRPANSGGRKPLPDHLPRQAVLYTPDADHPFLANAVKAKQIGRRIISRMAIEPLQVVIKDIDCPVMSLTLANGIKTQQTVAPPAIIANGQADDSVLIHTACDKVLDYLPCYRQSHRLERIGVDIKRSKLCRWHITLAAFLSTIASAIFDEIIASTVVGIDDTIHRLLDGELHRCKNGRLWAVTAGDNAFYQFSQTREGKWIGMLLGDYTGAVMGDAYAGHKVLLSRDHIIALYCWAHVRRKFFEAENCLKRQQALDLITILYVIEGDIAGHPPNEKVRQRTNRSAPILAQFKQLLDAWQADPHVLPKSAIGRATAYALNHWDGLCAYLDIGLAPIDNNTTENALRPNALHRKNSLFSASIAGAEAYAILSTVIHTAHNHHLNPYTYLADVVEDLHYQRRPPEELTPAKYAVRVGAEGLVNLPT